MIRALIILMIISAGYLFAEKINDEEILRAMRDEINRSLQELKLEDLKEPYYIEYKLTFSTAYDVTSTLGSVKSSDSIKRAELDVGLRVGDYEFDNTNFFDVGLSFFGSTDDEERFKNRKIPLHPDYETLRRELWLATDAAYKRAAEIYSKKEAVIQNRARVDTTPDFMKVKPRKNYIKKEVPSWDPGKYEKLCNELSSVFLKYPSLFISHAGIEYIPKKIYYVNSEGMEYTKTELFTGLESFAFAQAEDGMPVSNFYITYGKVPSDLPPKDSLINAVHEVAQKTSDMLKAPALEAPYSGPVLFTSQAAAEVFAQSFAPNFVTQREQLTEGGVQSNDNFGAFQMKIGGRVMPDFLSVESIPKKEKYKQTKLIGNYKIDDNGIPVENVNLVEDGYLQNLISARVPTRRVDETNGGKRGGAAMYSVLEVEAKANKQKSYEKLKSRMMELCKARELAYGLIVKKVINQNLMFTTLMRETRGSYTPPRGQEKFAIAELYKVYPDGREELIRGGQGSGFTHRSFRDVILTGKEKYVCNYLAPSVISPFMTGGDQYVGATVIVPGLLFEDAEIRTVDGTFDKPPYITRPAED